MTNKQKNKAAQELARLKHKKSPNSAEFYKKFSALGVAARKKKREEKNRIGEKR